MYKMNKHTSCMSIYYYCYNNIILNFYLIGYMFFPDKFKNKIINLKKTIDNCFNMIQMISFRDEILNKYQIDIFDVYKQFNVIMNPNKNRITNINDDNISVMSSVSSLSSFDSLSDDESDENAHIDFDSSVNLPFDFGDDI